MAKPPTYPSFRHSTDPVGFMRLMAGEPARMLALAGGSGGCGGDGGGGGGLGNGDGGGGGGGDGDGAIEHVDAPEGERYPELH